MSAALPTSANRGGQSDRRLHLGLPASTMEGPDMSDLEFNDTPLIIDTCRELGATRQQAAYILATAFWETNRQMRPVEEAYWLSDDWRKTNLRYYPWHGRGYVQLTWERNYIHAGEELDLDLTTDPKVVMQPDISAKILVKGSLEGWFTGRKLGDYISAGRCDYRNARRVINGTDKAASIAALAHEFDAALAGFGYAGAEPIETGRPVIRFNARGVMVAEMQTNLADLGYFSGRIDGHFGALTRAALLAFQADQGLDTDAVAGPMVWAALETADPRPTREISQTEIDEASGTAKDARMTERVGDLIGVGGVATLVSQMGAASDTLGAASGVLEQLSAVVTQNWPVVLLCAGCLFGWLALRALGFTTRKRRLRDAREHRSLSR